MIGGDGSLTGANLFRQEWGGLLEELVKSGFCPFSLYKKYTKRNTAPSNWLYHGHLRLIILAFVLYCIDEGTQPKHYLKRSTCLTNVLRVLVFCPCLDRAYHC